MFEQLYKLALANKESEAVQRRGFRFLDGNITATNLITTAKFADSRIAGIDAYVNCQLFMSAYKNTKTPAISKVGEHLLLKDGKYEVEVPLMDSEDFPEIDEPTGTEITPDTLADDLRLLRPFLRNSKDVPCMGIVYIHDGFLYYTDCMVLMRTPTRMKTEGTIAITKEFVDLMVTVDQAPIAALYDESTFSILYEDGWIHTNQDFNEAPLDFPEVCKRLETHDIYALDESFLKDLERMCATDPDGTLHFSADGVVIAGKSLARIKAGSNYRGSAPSRFLKKVLSVANCLDFNFDKDTIAFRGPHLEGLLSTSL